VFKSQLIAAAVVLAFAHPARAQESELSKIREEIKQLKEGYEKRIQTLEQRLSEAEAKAGKAESAATNAEQNAARAESATAAAVSARNGENAFNPAVSLILQGTYARDSQDPNTYHITGFFPSGGDVGPPKRSFGLGETELNVTANIDPYFRGVAIASLAPEGGVNVEEAYFQTLALPKGFTLKGGRFFSGIGYQNEIHQHAWDFQDAPLPYKAFLGGQLKQDGVQLKWVAPTDLLVELGAELSSGDQFPGNDRNKNGVGSGAARAILSAPRRKRSSSAPGRTSFRASTSVVVRVTSRPTGFLSKNATCMRCRCRNISARRSNIAFWPVHCMK